MRNEGSIIRLWWLLHFIGCSCPLMIHTFLHSQASWHLERLLLENSYHPFLVPPFFFKHTAGICFVYVTTEAAGWVPICCWVKPSRKEVKGSCWFFLSIRHRWRQQSRWGSGSTESNQCHFMPPATVKSSSCSTGACMNQFEADLEKTAATGKHCHSANCTQTKPACKILSSRRIEPSSCLIDD